MKPILVAFVILGGSASAQIDSGGGKAPVGSLTNHSSLGGSFSSGSCQAGLVTNRSGLIEVLYSASALDDPDSNGNGLPDDWEQQYFPGQTVDPESDSDGDGTSNLMEYLAATDPTDRTSVFRPEGTFSSTPILYTLPIQTVEGRSYKVWATRDLQEWVLRETLSGDGTMKLFTFDETAVESGRLHSNTHPSKYFFRVEIDLQQPSN